MAGGNETPRQKMIGMMYLVLTALLALNVSKQIVEAFITLNDKMDRSVADMDYHAKDLASEFEQIRALFVANRENTAPLDLWQGKFVDAQRETSELVGFLLSECNDMIRISEGEDWVEARDEHGNITKLKSLSEIRNMDNYDVPTNLFVGGNPSSPSDRGKLLSQKLQAFRDTLCSLMGTYTDGNNHWVFKSPEDANELSKELAYANPEDTSAIARIYRSLTVPEKLYSRSAEMEMPWISVMFDHAPIVAAAAIFTSLRLDVKNAEVACGEYMLSKVKRNPFRFNKIEPIAFANSSYLNQGDSANLSVVVAAFDTTSIVQVRYGIDADTSERDRWIETMGSIHLNGDEPGRHIIKGEIAVRQNNQTIWKPWEYSYEVGQPMGVVAQPQMRVFYWGYENIIEGTASGFSADRVKISGTGCSVTPLGNGKYKVDVSRGTRNATISVRGIQPDGKELNVGTFDFTCKPLPPPVLYFGSAEAGGSLSYTEAKNTAKVRVSLHPSIPLTNVSYVIKSGSIRFTEGSPTQGDIRAGGAFDANATRLIRQSAGKTVSIDVECTDPSGTTRIISGKFKITN